MYGKESTCKARDLGSVPGLGRSPGGGHIIQAQYSCLENPMNRGAWRATVHSVAKSQTQLKQLSMHTNKIVNVQECYKVGFFVFILTD